MFRVVFPSLSQNISKPYLDNYFSDTENKVSDVIVYVQTDGQTDTIYTFLKVRFRDYHPTKKLFIVPIKNDVVQYK